MSTISGFPGGIGAIGEKDVPCKDGLDEFIGVDGVTGTDGGYCRICPDRATGTVHIP